MIDLVTFIGALRDELDTARKKAEADAQAGDGILFAIEKTEIELSVVATQEGGANGKVSFSVLGLGAELGGNAKQTQQVVQKLKLQLNPIDADTGESLLISKRGFEMPDLTD